MILIKAILSPPQHLQESRRREGEERSNIRCNQKGRRQEGEAAPWGEGSLQGGGQSSEERHAGNAEERTAG